MEFCNFVISAFKQVFLQPIDKIRYIGDTIPLPKFEPNLIENLLKYIEEVFNEEGLVQRIQSPCIVVGDIHGSLFDLIHIFLVNGVPPKNKYVFLGDYIDRGEHQIEVIMFLLALHGAYPNNVYLLRGNHEFAFTNGKYGFIDQVANEYPNTNLYEKFNHCFGYMPLVGIVDDAYICVHGGISSEITYFDKISSIPKPILDWNLRIVEDIVWSDPKIMSDAFEVESDRGHGHLFDKSQLENFLENFELRGLIRGHQNVNAISGKWDDSVITICSISSRNENKKCGYAVIRNLKVHKRSLDPVSKRRRVDTAFYLAKKPSESLPGLSLGIFKSPTCIQMEARSSSRIFDTGRISLRSRMKCRTTKCSTPAPKLTMFTVKSII